MHDYKCLYLDAGGAVRRTAAITAGNLLEAVVAAEKRRWTLPDIHRFELWQGADCVDRSGLSTGGQKSSDHRL
jgi:hypothetical protein